MTTSRLIFFPTNTNKIIDKPQLLKTLSDSQFITTNAQTNNHYLPGDNFLSLITFLGCSPNINLQPTEGESHCFISIIKQTQQPRCLGHTQTATPKCPACKKRITEWKTPDWKVAGKTCTCDKCQKQTPYTELNWKQECGFARCGFEVNHIYPHEAVPTDQFLNVLNQASGFEWDYCYAND